ncbi:hypothetical protein T484DRAFT_1855075 [Baffinella frigidus]|nr:hypothetical protein T484DRAFT_1855075 [Cryptophyta sp. CCMP2293]
MAAVLVVIKGDSLATIAMRFGVAGDSLATIAMRFGTTGDSLATIAMRFGTTVRALLAINPDLALEASLGTGTVVCVLPMPTSLDGCPTLAKSSTWEKMEEQYIAPDYYDNPFNWEEVRAPPTLRLEVHRIRLLR